MKEEILALFRYGIPKRKGSIFDLRMNNFENLKAPVFFVSTGRTGTKWFADLFSKNKKTLVFHVPRPTFSFQHVFIYNLIKNNLLQKDDFLWQAVAEIFMAGREEILRYSYKTDKGYIETNNFLTFFVPVIAELIPNAKFVHLYRHPGEFVRSALSRNYYGENDPNIMRRILPVNDEFKEKWGKFTQIEKSAWLWYETNQIIEEFKLNLHKERVFSFNFNQLNIENVKTLTEFLDFDFPEKIIRKRLNKKLNVQKTKSFPPYKEWKEQDKQKLIHICGELAVRYGYNL
ncbi:MAG: sulfotransferase [bacterium]